jgi:gliding motility-associated-like protein
MINMKKILTFLLLITLSIKLIAQCSGNIEITSFDPNPYPDQTFPPNTSVDVCITMDGWTNISANWVDGFDLDLGDGWINVTPLSAPNDIDNPSGTWLWMDNVTSSVTNISVGPGYFFEENLGGGGGIVDGNPGNDWGDNCNLLNCSWSFCITLTTSNVVGQSLEIAVTALGDGTIGGYTGGDDCGNPTIIVWNGLIGDCPLGCTDPNACNFNELAACDDGTCNYFSMGNITHNLIPCPDTVCAGLEVNYAVTGNQSSFYDWHITGGGLLTTDQTNDCEIIWGDIPGTYTITVQEITEQGCIGDIKTCDVEVIVPDITFDTSQYKMCLNGSVELNAEPLGGSWVSDNMNGNTFLGTSPGTYYPSYITNIHGCDIQEEVEVIVKRKYEAPDIIYSAEIINFCTDSYNQTYFADDSIGVTYNWFIDDVRQPTTDNQLFVEWYDTTMTYIVKVIAYDEIGCESEPKLISVRTETCQRFFAPNSFTPNGDGINDVFIISGLSVYQPNLKIFNRWGVEVYISSNLWWTGDGGGGYYCDNGVYNWIIEYKDKLGQNKQESGHVTLIR